MDHTRGLAALERHIRGSIAGVYDTLFSSAA